MNGNNNLGNLVFLRNGMMQININITMARNEIFKLDFLSMTMFNRLLSTSNMGHVSIMVKGSILA